MRKNFMRKNSLTNEYAIEQVKNKCKNTDYEFISFCDEFGNECKYENQLTHVKMYCKKCKKIWFSATYNRIVHGGTGCPNCLKTSENEALDRIKKLCKHLNYTFLNFCDKNGNENDWGTVRDTYLHLKCNNCGNEWCSCSYTNFIRGRKCPICKSYFGVEKLERFKEKCKKNNWEIIGYVDENHRETIWEQCAFVHVKCLTCGYTWYRRKDSLQIHSGCPNCSNKLNAMHRIKKENECLELILDLCKKRDYLFLGYCNKSGEDCEWYGVSTYLKLKCLKCNRIWKTCTYDNFVRNLRGCPRCKQSHLEIDVEKCLLDNEIKYEYQKKFPWLGHKTLDFYLEDYSIAIECQGRQHFEPVEIFGGNDEFEDLWKRDTNKKQLCDEHGIKLLYYSNLGIDYPYEVIENIEVLLKKITE